MPRGKHPNSIKALEENRHKGQFKNGEKKLESEKQAMKDGWAKRRTFKQSFDELLERDFKDASGEVKQGIQIIAVRVFKEATEGNLKAVEIIRDTVGEKPIDKVQVQEIKGKGHQFKKGKYDYC